MSDSFRNAVDAFLADRTGFREMLDMLLDDRALAQLRHAIVKTASSPEEVFATNDVIDQMADRWRSMTLKEREAELRGCDDAEDVVTFLLEPCSIKRVQ